jgi:hypothetical protein
MQARYLEPFSHLSGEQNPTAVFPVPLDFCNLHSN